MDIIRNICMTSIFVIRHCNIWVGRIMEIQIDVCIELNIWNIVIDPFEILWNDDLWFWGQHLLEIHSNIVWNVITSNFHALAHICNSCLMISFDMNPRSVPNTKYNRSFLHQCTNFIFITMHENWKTTTIVVTQYFCKRRRTCVAQPSTVWFRGSENKNSSTNSMTMIYTEKPNHFSPSLSLYKRHSPLGFDVLPIFFLFCLPQFIHTIYKQTLLPIQIQ